MVQAFIVAGATLGAFAIGTYSGPEPNIALGRTMAFFTLVLGELLRAFSTRSERTSLFKLGLTTNKPMVLSVLGSLALMILLVLIPAAREAFGIALPSGNLWLVVGLMGLLPLVGGELHKLTLRKRHNCSVNTTKTLLRDHSLQKGSPISVCFRSFQLLVLELLFPLFQVEVHL